MKLRTGALFFYNTILFVCIFLVTANEQYKIIIL